MRLPLSFLLLLAFRKIVESNAKIDVTVINADTLVSQLLSATGGVTFENAQLIGSPNCAGLFTGGQDIVNEKWFPDTGIVLSTGNPVDLNVQNSDNSTTDFNKTGDEDLNDIVFGDTFDACVLEFDFNCSAPQNIPAKVSFSYVFGSDEYNEYVYSEYNDVFAWFLNGNNIALIPGTNDQVTIDNVNSFKNQAFFINNDIQDTNVPYPNMEADGFTVDLVAEGYVQDGNNHMKLAIADRGDFLLNSWALLKFGSLQCNIGAMIDLQKTVKPGLNEECKEGNAGRNLLIGSVCSDVTYCYRIANIGSVKLCNVRVSDPLHGFSANVIGCLAVGQVVYATPNPSKIPNGIVKSTATAVGTPCNQACSPIDSMDDVLDQDDAEVRPPFCTEKIKIPTPNFKGVCLKPELAPCPGWNTCSKWMVKIKECTFKKRVVVG